MAYEEPEYKLIKSTDVYEIRQYQDRLAVETTQSKAKMARLEGYSTISPVLTKVRQRLL